MGASARSRSHPGPKTLSTNGQKLQELRRAYSSDRSISAGMCGWSLWDWGCSMDDRQTRLNEVARIAVDLESQTGCPAQLLIAQWALESKWGAKPAGNANFFGVKKSDRHEKCSTVSTREVVNGKSGRAGPGVRRLRLARRFLQGLRLANHAGCAVPPGLGAVPERSESARADRGGRRQIRDRPAICIPGRHNCRPVERGAGHRQRAPGGDQCKGLRLRSRVFCWRH